MSRRSKSKRAGVCFPVTAVQKKLKKRHGHGGRVSNKAAVYLCGVMEYLAAEVLELAGNEAEGKNKKRITPRHIFLAVANDAELSNILNGNGYAEKHIQETTILESGRLPNINSAFLPKMQVR